MGFLYFMGFEFNYITTGASADWGFFNRVVVGERCSVGVDESGAVVLHVRDRLGGGVGPCEHVEQPRQVLLQHLLDKTAIPPDVSTTHVGLALVWDVGTTSTGMLNTRC